MPRTKGSKNKPKTVTADFATQIAEKQSAKEVIIPELSEPPVRTLGATIPENESHIFR